MNTEYDQFVFDDCLISPVNGVQYKKLNNRNIQSFGFDSIEDLHNQYPDFPLICNRLKTTYISVSNQSKVKIPNISFSQKKDINIEDFIFHDKLISPITGYTTRKINVQNIKKFGFHSVEELNELWPNFPLVCQELDDIYKEK